MSFKRKKFKRKKYIFGCMVAGGLIWMMFCFLYQDFSFWKRISASGLKNIKNEKVNIDFQVKTKGKLQQFVSSLSGKGICVVDVTQNKILAEKRADKQIAPASTAKLLTALTVLELCEVTEVVTVGDELGLVAADASRAGIEIGDSLTVKQLLEGMLLPSGNDAAYALAVYAGRKIAGQESDVDTALSCFMKEMNEMGKKLGARHSHFVHPDGYDGENQYTTARDLACISVAFMKSSKENGLLREIVKKPKIRECFLNGRDVTWRNTNLMLDGESAYYNPEIIGLKTGSSEEAGKCLISAISRKNTVYLVVMMGCEEEERYENSRAIYQILEK